MHIEYLLLYFVLYYAKITWYHFIYLLFCPDRLGYSNALKMQYTKWLEYSYPDVLFFEVKFITYFEKKWGEK